MMAGTYALSDEHYPLDQTTAQKLVSSYLHSEEKMETIFHFGIKSCVYIGAAAADHGVRDDFSTGMSQDNYTAMVKIQQMSFPITAKIANRNLKKIRQS